MARNAIEQLVAFRRQIESIIKYASEDIKKEILPKLVSGECVGTLAVTEDLLAPTENNISVTSINDEVSGKKIAVPDAGVATHAIVVCKGANGIELRLVELNQESCIGTNQENIDECCLRRSKLQD